MTLLDHPTDLWPLNDFALSSEPSEPVVLHNLLGARGNRSSTALPCDGAILRRSSTLRVGQPGVLPYSTVASTLAPLVEQAGALEFLAGDDGFVRIGRSRLDLTTATDVSTWLLVM